MKHRSFRLSLGFLALVLLFSLFSLSFIASNALAEGEAAAALPVIEDFESGIPGGGCGAVWFCVGDGNEPGTEAVEATDLRQFGSITNTVASVTYDSASWGGLVGQNLATAQDWSSYAGISFWFKGTNTGNTITFVIDQGAENSSNYQATFVDDADGWQLVSLPWTVFSYREGAGDTGMPLTSVNAYMFIFEAGTSGSFLVDQVAVYESNSMFYTDHMANPGGDGVVAVSFSDTSYTVTEGDVATVTVKLSAAPVDPITVTYTIADGTATLGEDYAGPTGSLVFAPNAGSLVFPNGVTEQSFAIQTIDDTLKESAIETATLTLNNPQGAELGARVTATLNIQDNESICTVRSTIVDGFDNYGLDFPFELTDSYSNTIGFLTFSDGSSVALTATNVISGDMLARPGQSMTNTIMRFDSNIGGWGGFTHNFENEAGDTWVTQDWSTYEGLALWIYGTGRGTDIAIELQENRPVGATVPSDGGPEVWNATFEDDFVGWEFIELPWSAFGRKEIGNGAPNDGLTLENVRGWAFLSLASGGAQTHYFDNVQVCGEREVVRTLDVNFTRPEFTVTEGQTATLSVALNMTHTEAITVDYIIQETGATPGIDYEATGGTLVFAPGETEQSFTVPTYQDDKYEADERAVFVMTNVSTGTLGFQQRGVLVIEEDDPFNPALLDDYETGQHQLMVGEGLTVTVTAIEANAAEALPNQVHPEHVLSVTYNILSNTNPFPAGFEEQFGGSQSWLNYSGFSFWMYGQNSGQTMQVELLGQREADPGPDGWELVWSDEFSETAGTPPNPKYWTHEIGDGALNGITGWGNGEFQYYTDSTDNAATDGNGNLVITARKVATDDTSLTCWYGPCEYTSARLISKNKLDFAYGRIEARVKVPAGEGLWPAFWMLGNDIDQVNWPTSGEIDIVEYVGKDPNAVYGTLHGPGHFGGNAYGSGPFDLGQPVADNFHLFAVEWEEDVVRWYIDDTNFFTATKTGLMEQFNVTEEAWVYDHPFFLLLNLAVGGNFPGNPTADTPFPAEMIIDYVRVYQAPDTSDRFAATFEDNFTGWQQVTLPFDDFTPTSGVTGTLNQPSNLSQMWGYGFDVPADSQGHFYLDQILLTEAPEMQGIYLPLILK